MPKEKRELKFNTANGDGVGVAKYETNKSSILDLKVKQAFGKAQRKFEFPPN